MNQPVTYVEPHSADLPSSLEFFKAVFGWDPQPFAGPDYFVSPSDSERGIDAGLLPPRGGTAHTVSVIGVNDLDQAVKRVGEHGGKVVVEPFEIAGVGRGCYVTDPSGLLVGLHENNPNA